jgi:hypothetical protein
MLKEAEIFGNVLLSPDGPITLCEFGPTTDNFDPEDPLKRPAGWATVKAKRVSGRVRADRDHGVSEDVAERNRVQYLVEVRLVPVSVTCLSLRVSRRSGR